MNKTADSQEASPPLKGVNLPVLLCAATRWEAEPLAARFSLKAVSEGRYEGFLDGQPVVLLKTGIGPVNAARALSALPPSDDFARVLSVGLAGALQPGMASGDLAADIQGADLEIAQAARETAAEEGTPIHFGRFLHADKVLQPVEKAALGDARRACAVDMESATVRAWAEAKGVPALTVRVILDRRDDRLPRALPSGEDFASLLSYAVKNAAELPLMLMIGLKQRKAMANLAGFLEEFLPKL